MLILIALFQLFRGYLFQDLNIPPGQLKAVNINGTEIIWEFNTNGVIAFCITNANPHGGCIDHYKDCNKKAEYGECFIKPVFMLTFCKASCQVCPKGFRSAKGFGRCVTEIEIKKIPPKPAYFTQWNSWSNCTGSCGNEQRNRTRKCIYPKKDSRKCTGQREEVIVCQSQACIDERDEDEELEVIPENNVEVIAVSSRRNCGNTEFRCIRSGACIPVFLQCDGIVDCKDKSDEQNCPEPTTTVTSTTTTKQTTTTTTTTPATTTTTPATTTTTTPATTTTTPATTTTTTTKESKSTANPFFIIDLESKKTENRKAQVQVIQGERRRAKPQLLLGTWNEWSGFGVCSTTCGEGLKFRSRKCGDDKRCATTWPIGGTAKFESEQLKCNEDILCPEAISSEWNEWERCSKSCDIGSTKRTRVCNKANKCVGEEKQEKTCNLRPCNENLLGDWSTWSQCSRSCSGGFHTRTRSCNHVDKRKCNGWKEEQKACVNDFCNDIGGIGKAQDIAKRIIENSFDGDETKPPPSGKFYKALLDLLVLIAEEYSIHPREDSIKNLSDLENLLRRFAKQEKYNFARRLLAKILVMYNKLQIKDGVAIDDYSKVGSRYIEKLKADIGGSVFEKIMDRSGDVTLIFAIDTTGSMQPEIDAAKAIANTIINSMGSKNIDYILSPFNDPGTGPITYKTSKEKEGFVYSIGNLTVQGGGDCPEMSISGILNALSISPRYGSPMFVFTDASAKDDTAKNMAAVRAAASQLGVSISFFTRKQGCFGVQRGGIRSYRNLAAHTSGQIFPIVNTKELIKFANYTIDELQMDTDINAVDSFVKYRHSRYRRSFDGMTTTKRNIEIDDAIKKFVLSVSTEFVRDNKNMKLIDPSGVEVTPSTILNLATIFDVNNPVNGTWQVIFPPFVKGFKYVVKGASRNPIEFTHRFIYEEHSNYSYLSNPIKGRRNKILVRIGGLERLIRHSIFLDVVDTEGVVITKSLKLESEDDVEVFFSYLTAPSVPFRILFKGITKTGSKFERVSRQLNTATSLFIKPKQRWNDTLISCKETELRFPFEIFNFGYPAVVYIRVSSLLGQSYPIEEGYVVYKKRPIVVTYIPPTDRTLCNRPDRITITVNRRHSDEQFEISYPFLLT